MSPADSYSKIPRPLTTTQCLDDLRGLFKQIILVGHSGRPQALTLQADLLVKLDTLVCESLATLDAIAKEPR